MVKSNAKDDPILNIPKICIGKSSAVYMGATSEQTHSKVSSIRKTLPCVDSHIPRDYVHQIPDEPVYVVPPSAFEHHRLDWERLDPLRWIELESSIAGHSEAPLPISISRRMSLRMSGILSGVVSTMMQRRVAATCGQEESVFGYT